jgi:uncharacterized protein
MEELIRLSLLFAIGSVAGFINVMAGGGSTITLPTLIFLGLDSSLANGTNRVAILIQNISGIISFRRENYHQFTISLKLALFTVPGAIAGSIVATVISDTLFQEILAYVLIGIIISLLLPRPNKKQGKDLKHYQKNWLIYPAMVLVGFYGGFIQAGVGFLLMASLYHLMKLDLIRVNMHKIFIVAIYMIPSLAIFLITHNIDFKFGLTLAAGNALGAWWSAKVSVKKGQRVIQFILIGAILLMSLRLLDII